MQSVGEARLVALSSCVTDHLRHSSRRDLGDLTINLPMTWCENSEAAKASQDELHLMRARLSRDDSEIFVALRARSMFSAADGEESVRRKVAEVREASTGTGDPPSDVVPVQLGNHSGIRFRFITQRGGGRADFYWVVPKLSLFASAADLNLSQVSSTEHVLSTITLREP